MKVLATPKKRAATSVVTRSSLAARTKSNSGTPSTTNTNRRPKSSDISASKRSYNTRPSKAKPSTIQDKQDDDATTKKKKKKKKSMKRDDRDEDYTDWIGRRILRDDDDWDEEMKMKGTIMNAYEYKNAWYFRIRYEDHFDTEGNVDEEDIGLKEFEKSCTFITHRRILRQRRAATNNGDKDNIRSPSSSIVSRNKRGGKRKRVYAKNTATSHLTVSVITDTESKSAASANDLPFVGVTASAFSTSGNNTVKSISRDTNTVGPYRRTIPTTITKKTNVPSSSLPPSQPSSITKSQIHSKKYPFPHKLYDLMVYATESTASTAAEDAVAWSSDGTIFVVRDHAQFASELLPKYFGHNKPRSFERQLHFWGFELASTTDTTTKVSDRKSGGKSWRHPFFQRGRRDLLKNILRKKRKKGPFSQRRYTFVDDNKKGKKNKNLTPPTNKNDDKNGNTKKRLAASTKKKSATANHNINSESLKNQRQLTTNATQNKITLKKKDCHATSPRTTNGIVGNMYPEVPRRAAIAETNSNISNPSSSVSSTAIILCALDDVRGKFAPNLRSNIDSPTNLNQENTSSVPSSLLERSTSDMIFKALDFLAPDRCVIEDTNTSIIDDDDVDDESQMSSSTSSSSSIADDPFVEREVLSRLAANNDDCLTNDPDDENKDKGRRDTISEGKAFVMDDLFGGKTFHEVKWDGTSSSTSNTTAARKGDDGKKVKSNTMLMPSFLENEFNDGNDGLFLNTQI